MQYLLFMVCYNTNVANDAQIKMRLLGFDNECQAFRKTKKLLC